jgi:hypothetical protein
MIPAFSHGSQAGKLLIVTLQNYRHGSIYFSQRHGCPRATMRYYACGARGIDQGDWGSDKSTKHGCPWATMFCCARERA